MRKVAVLGGLVTGTLALLLISPGGIVGDAGLVAMIACIGIYLSWMMPMQDG